MEKSIEILLKSLKVSTEKAKKNRALDFICGKGLANEFNNKK